jgi:hypothetical protein
MGKMKSLALDLQEQIENEWELEQRALLLSQGHTAEEVDEIIEEMINEYQQEVALDNADIMVEPYDE